MAQEDVGMPEVVITLEPDPPDLDIIEEEGGGMEEDPLGDVADANTEAPQIVEEEGADIMEEQYPLDDVVDAGPILGNSSYGSGQYDSEDSLPDPEKGTDASPGDAEDSPWSPPGSLVEDEADSGSDSDEEEGDNEYGEEGANIMEEEYPLDDVVDAGPILGNSSYDAIDRHCSPGHDEEIDPYQGNPSILNMDAFALRHAGQEMSPPHQVNFVTLHSPTSSQEGQVCVNPSKFLSTKTSVEVMFVTD